MGTKVTREDVGYALDKAREKAKNMEYLEQFLIKSHG